MAYEHQRYRKAHLKQFNEYQKSYYQKNRERILSGQHERTKQLKDAVYQKLGNKCSNPACQWLNADGTRGCTDRRCLQIDHVYNDGHLEKHRKVRSFYKKVLADQTGRYQILCSNCNWIKRGDAI